MIKNYHCLLVVLFILTGCTQDENYLREEPSDIQINQHVIDGIQLESNKIKFSSKTELSNFIKSKTEEEFKDISINLRKSGFKSLTPRFLHSENKEEREYLEKKKDRLQKKSNLYTSKNTSDSEVELDDELIMDSRFATLLNENREIIVGDSLYVYTTRGLFYAKAEDEEDLRRYLRSLEEQMNTNKYIQEEPCLETYDTPENISYYSDCGGGGTGGGGYTGGGGTSTSYDEFPLDIKRSLTVCTVEAESLWQKIFGEAETCHDYFADDRRAKTTFWNQNYYIFSSIGMRVKHQKRNWGIWDSSDATDYIELGITNVSFKYHYNTQVYDDIFWNIQSEVIIKWKGVTYTADGRVIYGYPLQASTLPLDASDNASLSVYLLNKNRTIIDEQQANDIIRDAARSFISNYGSSLETPVSNTADNLSIDGVVIDPLSNSITMMVVGKTYRGIDASSVEKYLDFNIMANMTLKLSGGSYSVGENGPVYNSGVNSTFDAFGATSYTDVTLDMYGVVRRDGNVYRGNRMISENID